MVEIVDLEEEEEPERLCKICYDSSAELGGGFISPCKCSGSIEWV
jgi:E3 ubiquitin-protein ligase DOA10